MISLRRINAPDFDDKDIYTTAYSSFLGCMFTADESKCAAEYSPDCVNLIPDVTGYPEKRVGWRTLQKLTDPVYGVHAYSDGETTSLLVHSGTKLYRMDTAAPETLTLLYSGMQEQRSWSFPYGGKLYVLDGGSYLCYDGAALAAVGDSGGTTSAETTAFIPTTSILRTGAGGGDTYQDVNLLTRWRRNTFVTDGTTTTFQLDGSVDAGTTVSVDVDLAFTVDYANGTITFASAPPAAVPSGTQGLTVTFAHTVSGYADRVKKCRFSALYGSDASNFVFLSGNPDYKNALFHSENNDPTYFSDLNYIEVGVANFAITGFLKNSAGELTVLKEHGSPEATIWHVAASLSADETINGTYFAIREGVSGTGCVTPWAQQQLKNDSLFLAPSGVYNVGTSYSAAKLGSYIALRSAPVNLKLLYGETALTEAVSCVWKQNYMLFLGGCAYIMTADRNWWYWEHMPVSSCCTVGDTLYFGTEDGRLCRTNDDLITDQGEYRMRAFHDDGKAITARWTTAISADGTFFRAKNLEKNGFGVYIKTYPRTSVTIYLQPLDRAKQRVKTFVKSRFSFNDVDFQAFSFTTQATYVCPMRQRLRGYAGLQIIVENSEVYEGFGLSQIVYNYSYGKYLRR